MAHTTYTRPLTDFVASGGVVAPDALKVKLNSGSIVPQALSVHHDGFDCAMTFTGPLSAPEEAVLDDIVATHNGISLAVDDVVKTSVQKPRTPELNFHTPNWCDPTTWYQRSVRVTGEVMQCANTEEYKRFSTKHSNIIDMIHGNVMMEDRISAPYLCKVYVNGELKREDKPLDYLRRKNDYAMNYRDGIIDFHESLDPADVVTIDYSWSTNSSFSMVPIAGKRIVVNMAEADFSVGYDIRDTVRYQAFIPAQVLMAMAPTDFPSIAHVQGWLLSSEIFSADGTIEALNKFLGKVDSMGEGTSDALTLADKVPVPNTDRVYKRYWDFKSQSNGNYAPMPPLGGPLRGETEGSATHPFGYVTAKEVDSTTGSEIRIWLEEHIPFGGSRATATFYCSVEDV